jgi:hypothetical protein
MEIFNGYSAIENQQTLVNSERFPLIRGNVEDKRVKKQIYIPLLPRYSGLAPESQSFI